MDLNEKNNLSKQLLRNISDNLFLLESVLIKNDFEYYEDDFYRFYHNSFKVYNLQEKTENIVKTLRSVLPGIELNEWFLKIIKEGTGKKFKLEHNKNWLKITRPILEAFFHSRHFLQLAVKYGRYDKKLDCLPSGMASLLYLYNLR